MGYDVPSVRGLYTSLSDGWIYFNAHDCPQVPERVSAAVARSFRISPVVSTPEPAGGSHAKQFSGAAEGTGLLVDAAVAVADLVGATPDRVVLGPSLPYLYASLAASIRPLVRRASTIVLNNVDRVELTSALLRTGADVRWAAADLATGELPGWQYMDLVDGATRLVSVPAAHPHLGVIAPVAEIVETVRAQSRAWVLVDASAYAPYRPISFDEWGADIVAVDLKEMGGPEIAALVFRDAAMFARLESITRPGARGAEKLSLGISPGLAGGVAATVDHYASFHDAPAGRASRRHRLATSMGEAARYLNGLRDDLHTFLGTLPAVHIVGVSGEAAAETQTEIDRIARLSFGVVGVPAETVYQRLLAHGIVATLTPPSPLTEDMGVDELGGAVTVSLSPFNTSADIDQLIRTVASLA
ncbi:aminotransferase class V-fold PLP-dependent enzyme [Corynebacterium liangguodongii]|uniref:Cysteine desulfurase n=1 Tax=Corynebacterium liangguodongii TaxID=2079535 RepID=A0A2S0WBM0_9CORY|nr:aminotransferase class V-fold PLP-dependent enzyme [Corynebacterium liangguodongii]AWB83163.1 cysteine desulfurase [Corynebacterium liangguodongii]PWB98758.1 aminotransferase class V-fold PLP-dependent enzyme [Corynebacterium liangguodongii]